MKQRGKRGNQMKWNKRKEENVRQSKGGERRNGGGDNVRNRINEGKH